MGHNDVNSIDKILIEGDRTAIFFSVRYLLLLLFLFIFYTQTKNLNQMRAP